MKQIFSNFTVLYEDDECIYASVKVETRRFFMTSTAVRGVASMKDVISFWFADSGEFTPQKDVEKLYEEYLKCKEEAKS